MKRLALLAPFLFTLASLLQLNYVALIVASPEQLVRPLIALWLVVLALFLVLYLILRDESRAALLSTIFTAGFYFSPSFFSTVFLSTAIVAIPWGLFLRLKKQPVNAIHVLSLLSAISLFFIAYSLLLMSQVLAAVPWGRYQDSLRAVDSFSLSTAPTMKRDIYLIILDGYGRADILEEIYKFDNSRFIRSLEQAGFTVPSASVSNYPATHLSVASMLNMDYIYEFAPGLEKSYQRWLMASFIDHSRVRAFLAQQGYATVSISTNWSITDNPAAEIYYSAYPIMLNDFEGFLLDSTPLKLFGPLLDGFASVPSFETQRKVILYNFETLARLPELPSPKFVVAHVISPHPPFVFDAEGEMVDMPGISFSFKDAAEYGGSHEEYGHRYIDQLQFINNQITQVVEAILSQSETPPIIIIQADHGPGIFVDFASARDTCIRERFSTFAAYYLPDMESHIIPSDISNVNVFRIIFNEYFNAELPMIENKQYFYRQPVSFYDFEEVTARQNVACGQP